MSNVPLQRLDLHTIDNPVLGANIVPPELERVVQPAKVHVKDAWTPPNVGHRTLARIQDARPRGWYTIADTGALVLLEDGKLFDSPQDDKSRALMAEELKKEAPIVMFGVGAGHSIHCARNYTGAPILVFEPDPARLKRFLELNLPLPGTTLCCDIDEFRAMFPFFLRGTPSATITAHPGTVEKHQEQHSAFLEVVHRVVDAEQITENTIRIRMPEWIDCMIANLPAIIGSTPALALTGRLVGIPAFIVGAGPSLDKNGHLLNECKRHGIVLGIEASTGALVHHGCEPHMMMTVEAKPMSAHFAGVEWMGHVPRLFSMQSHPQSFRSGSGRLMPWVDSNYPFVPINRDVLHAEGVPLGGSVSTGCCLLAEAWGCSPIVLVGQDLANGETATHAYGTLNEHVTHLVNVGTVECWGGGRQIPTAPQWDHARVWFEGRALRLREMRPEVRLVNATEGGSRIRGYDEVPLAGLLSELPEIDATAVLNAACDVAARVSRDDVVAYLDHETVVCGEIANGADVLARCTKQVVAAIQDNDAGRIGIALAARDEAERAYRATAGASHLFTGQTQELIKAMHTAQKAMQDAGERPLPESVPHFEAMLKVFDDMRDEAHKLVTKLTAARQEIG